MGAHNSHDFKNFMYNVSIKNKDKKDNESFIFRNQNSIGNDLFVENPDFPTIHHLYKKILHKGDLPFLGTRYDRDGTLTNSFTFRTYKEVFRMAEEFGSALDKYVKVNDKSLNLKFVSIHSKNNPNYIITDIACCLYGYTMIPMYDTLGDEANNYIYESTGVTVSLIESTKLEKIVKLRKEKNWYKNVEIFILLDDFRKRDEKILEEARKYFKVVEWDDIRAEGEENVNPWKKVTPKTIYTFSYTGGTTGTPKGAMFSHENVMSIQVPVRDRLLINSDSRHISYLPIPHILERAIFLAMIGVNAQIGVYSGDKLKLIEDIQLMKPTLFVSAPRLFNKIYAKVLKGVSEKSFIAKGLFNKAMTTKLYNLREHGYYSHGLYDKLVFAKVRNLLGGCITMFLSGGAPLNKDVMDFFKISYSVPFIEAYGQTEGTGAEFSTMGYESEAGTVGGLFDQCEFKLVDVPEMNYFHTDKDSNGNATPRGEVWVRGPNLIKGYYKMPEKTQEMFENGWLKSGDIAMVTYPNQALKIIDRKKHIFKLSQGEYVAPKKLENIYKSVSEFIGNIYVYGDSTENYCVAAINIEPGCLKSFVEYFGFEEGPGILKNKELIDKVIKRLDEYAKEKGLNSIEKLRNIILDNSDWSTLDLVTPAFKNRRINLRKHYGPTLKKLYK